MSLLLTGASRAARRTLASKTLLTPTLNTATASRSITTHSQLPEEHQMIYDMCRRFADEEIAPNAAKWDQKHEFPDKVKDMVRYVMVLLWMLCRNKQIFANGSCKDASQHLISV